MGFSPCSLVSDILIAWCLASMASRFRSGIFRPMLRAFHTNTLISSMLAKYSQSVGLTQWKVFLALPQQRGKQERVSVKQQKFPRFQKHCKNNKNTINGSVLCSSTIICTIVQSQEVSHHRGGPVQVELAISKISRPQWQVGLTPRRLT